MVKRLLALGSLIPSLFLGAPAIHAQVNCGFSNGFATLDSLIPDQVGGCLTDPHPIANGDVVQQTVGGLLSWNPADNLPEFTNGSQTWVWGPNGLQVRPNNHRFSYEAPQSQVAGISIGSTPSANVVACLTAAINASGATRPVSTSVVLTPGSPSC